jgi:hypothetical protein
LPRLAVRELASGLRMSREPMLHRSSPSTAGLRSRRILIRFTRVNGAASPTGFDTLLTFPGGPEMGRISLVLVA